MEGSSLLLLSRRVSVTSEDDLQDSDWFSLQNKARLFVSETIEPLP